MEIIQTINEIKDTGKKGKYLKKRVLGFNNKSNSYKKKNSFNFIKNIQEQKKDNESNKENETVNIDVTNNNKPFIKDKKRSGVKEDCKLLIHHLPPETKQDEIPKLFIQWLPDFNADDVTSVQIWYTKKPPLGHQAKGVAVVVVKSNEERDALVNYGAQHFPIEFTNKRGISSEIFLKFAYPLDEKEKERKNERFQNRNKFSQKSQENISTSSDSSSEAKDYKKVCLETVSISKNEDSSENSEKEIEEILSFIKAWEVVLKHRCPDLFESELEMKALNETEISLGNKIKNQKEKIKEANLELKLTREQFEQYEFLTV